VMTFPHKKYSVVYVDPRIELFARRRIEGWDAWGDQLPEF